MDQRASETRDAGESPRAGHRADESRPAGWHPAHELHGPLAEVADLPTDDPLPLPETPAPARVRLRRAIPPTPADAG